MRLHHRPGQVFGLMDGPADAGGLLSAASRPRGPVLMTEVVSKYRCGAAPEWVREPGFARAAPDFPFNSIASFA